MINAEMSPERFWRGPRFREFGVEGELFLTLHCHHEDDCALVWAAGETKSQDCVHKAQVRRERRSEA